MNNDISLRRCLTAACLFTVALPACGDRDAVWSAAPTLITSHGLAGAAAFVDVNAGRVLLTPVAQDLTISPVSVPMRRGFASSQATPDGSALLVLARGDVPRQKADDQKPGLAMIDGGATPHLLRTYDISDPLSGLAIDPEGHFAVIYPSAADSSFVANPNELAIVDLAQPPGLANPTSLTLRSFGGRPEALVFTPTLGLPGAARRLLVVLTDRDVGLIDLSQPEKGDVTVRLSSTGDRVTPVQVAVSDGDPARDDDARLAIRLAGDPSVILVDLVKSTASDSLHDFKPTPNVVLASGPPSDVAFVNTDGGLRLAALVPSKQSLSLIDPATGVSKDVLLDAPYEHLSLVTGVVGGSASGADVALLWSASSPYISFVALGSTAGKPYKSVERLQLEQPVARVINVPAPNDRLKILAAADGRAFFVLDLIARTASPILSSAYGVQVTVSADGQRSWLLAPGGSDLAALSLFNLHPQNFTLGSPLQDAFEVSRLGGGRALIAVHSDGDLGLTVLDGEHPSLETAVQYRGLLLGSLR
ncbi:MAG: hypothetical protein ABJE95_01920 [Byssovorax sp.]